MGAELHRLMGVVVVDFKLTYDGIVRQDNFENDVKIIYIFFSL